MYSTFATTADADGIDENIPLFGESREDTFSMHLSHGGIEIKTPGSNMVPINGLNKFLFGRYDESTSSSTQYGDTHENSEGNSSHMSGRDDRDTSISSSYVNGQGHSHASSPLHLLPYQNGTHRFVSPRTMDPNAVTTPDAARPAAPQPVKEPRGPPNDGQPDPLQDSTIKQNQILQTVESLRGDTRSSMSQRQPRLATHPKSRSAVTKGKAAEFRANSSIPASMSWGEFARQSILAAESSRLNPFALHPQEYKMLRHHVTNAQVTIYLNIRNAILRLWTRNPMLNVTLEEAAGCAREKRYFDLAKTAYYWLMRNGYINFGCVEVANSAGTLTQAKLKKGSPRTILVIGAGMAGLGCARHLEGLISQLGDQWTNRGELPPKVIVLEARPRIGGRVYSHPLRNQADSNLPAGHRCTAEMGAQIVTGFERGNPMNAIIRGQLGIPYHGLRDNTVLYDHDGTIVERSRDILVERLYNDVLERASIYRNKPTAFRTVEGDRSLMILGRDPSDTGGPTIATLEQSNTPLPAHASTTASRTEEKPSTGVEKLAGRAYQLSAGFNPDVSVRDALRNMGWQLNPGAGEMQSMELDNVAKSSEYPTLGKIMDEGIGQFQNLLTLETRDLRLLNWHHANLEYANAVNVNQLSLSGWDQDIGNEFEGEHTQIIGGYQQVPRGLWQLPNQLDVRFKAAVSSIHYQEKEPCIGKAVRVTCHNGEVFEADEVVLTTPLGVLKSGSITFDPPLPSWKEEVIERMGFGLLNKVVLVYERAFWEPDRDMFGLLNEAEHQASLDMKDYASQRGKFYLFWNCIKTSGRPTLVALMAGNAAHYAEANTDEYLIKEVTDRLAKMFAPKSVPLPSEAIVTRWSKDPYARGSYSYVGPRTLAGDYDVMARPHGPLHFAGEATCGTHPATVHGAYLSGLRAAAEVLEGLLGPIEIPSPLVEKKVKVEQPPTPASQPIKHRLEPEAIQQGSANLQQPRPDEEYEASIIAAIRAELGERPSKPGRGVTNPFLLFTKDQWYICKKELDDARRAATGKPDAKASRTEIRGAVGSKWRKASEETRKPYIDRAQSVKDDAAANAVTFKQQIQAWDNEAARIRREYIQNNRPPGGNEHLYVDHAIFEMSSGKRTRRS